MSATADSPWRTHAKQKSVIASVGMRLLRESMAPRDDYDADSACFLPIHMGVTMNQTIVAISSHHFDSSSVIRPARNRMDGKIVPASEIHEMACNSVRIM
jgi:hypothetical protein